MNHIKVVVPCSTANLGPGFDTLGLALSLYNELYLAETEQGLKVEVTGEGARQLPKDDSNLVVRAAKRIFREVDYRPNGLQFRIHNNVPVSSGLGSSSTAIVAGMVAANELAGKPLTKRELLQIATEMEGHPDNVTPALYGGLNISILAGRKVYTEQITIKPLRVSIVLPNYEMQTSEARAVLPSMVPRADAVHNIGRTALLVQALQHGNHEKLRIYMQDKMHQPYRLPLVPGLKDGWRAALEVGAYGVALSGAGPALAIFAPEGSHDEILRNVRDAFFSSQLSSRSWTLDVDLQGAQCTVEDATKALTPT